MKLSLQRVNMAYFAGLPVLVDVSFDAEGDGVFGIYGGRYAGKTTLMRVVAGLEKLTGGSVLVDGVEVSSLKCAQRNIALFVETKPLFKHKTAYRNIEYPLRIRKVNADERYDRVTAIAEKLGIGIGILMTPAYMLDATMSARVQLARMLVRDEGGLYLLDNPLRHFSGDERSDAFDTLMEIISSRKGLYLYATDSTDEITSIGNTLYSFDKDAESKRIELKENGGKRRKKQDEN